MLECICIVFYISTVVKSAVPYLNAHVKFLFDHVARIIDLFSKLSTEILTIASKVTSFKNNLFDGFKIKLFSFICELKESNHVICFSTL